MANEKNDEKRPYVKPEIKQVALRPEEAVLGACKASQAAAAAVQAAATADAGAVQFARLVEPSVPPSCRIYDSRHVPPE